MKNDCNCQPSCCCPSNEEVFSIFKNAAEEHNRELMYVTSLPNFLDFNFAKAFKASTDFCTAAYPMNNVTNIITFADAKVFYDKLVELQAGERQAEFGDYLFSRGLMNIKQMEFYKLTVNTVLRLQDQNPGLVPAAMIGLQNSLLSRTDLSANDKAIMYATSAISVAAMNFWLAALDDPNNKWHSRAIGSNLPAWLSNGLRDLGGFVAGAIAGTLIGGPVLGGIGGSLVGAACSNAK